MNRKAVNPNDYALVVGINHYPKHKPLDGAIRDADCFEEWLIAPDGGGLDQDNCEKILSEAMPLNPYQKIIDDKLEELVRKVKKTKGKRGRRFYFFFSGHGCGVKFDDNALCLAAWSKDRRNLALSSHEYLDYIINSGLFKEVMFFLDCCRNRVRGVVGLHPTLTRYAPDDFAGQTKRFVAYATLNQARAYESRAPGNARGHFTTALISGLRGGARNVLGEITPEKLASYLESETSRLAQNAGHNQVARVTEDFSDNDKVFFGPIKAAKEAGHHQAARVTDDFPAIDEGAFVTIDDIRDRIREAAGRNGEARSFNRDVTVSNINGLRDNSTFSVLLTRPSDFTKISIISKNTDIVDTAYGSFQAALPYGTYTVRAELNGRLEEKDVDHLGISTIEIKTPENYSAALLGGFCTSHEYYTEPAIRWSEKDTTSIKPASPSDKNGAFFIFLRYISRETFEKSYDPGSGSLGKDFALLDAEQKVVSSFTDEEIEEDQDNGWLAFSTAAEPGLYFLEYSGKTPRQVPLYIYEKRQTQVFIAIGEEPLFGSMRIFMKGGKGFDPDDKDSIKIDNALNMLYNGEYDFPPGLLESFSHDIGDPIFGLLAGYLNCSESGDEDRLRQIINDLEQLLKIGESPDIQALKVAAAGYFKSDIPGIPLDKPPMILMGINAAIKESAENPGLIPGGSLTDIISPNLYSDTPWTSWEVSHAAIDAAPDWVKYSMKDLLENNRKTERPTNLNVLAQDLQLSPQTIERISTGLSFPEQPLKGNWSDTEMEQIINSLDAVLNEK